MKIWTITTDQDGEGTATAVYTTEAAARGAYASIIAAAWKNWFGRGAAPMPDDTAKALEVLTMQTGFVDIVMLTEHDISDHPALSFAVTALEVAERFTGRLIADPVAAVASVDHVQLIDLHDDIADAACMLRGSITPDEPEAFGVSPNLQDHAESVNAAYRKAATDQATDDLEIDPDAYVAVSDDGDGAFVAAWLWVPESEAAKHLPPLPQEKMQ